MSDSISPVKKELLEASESYKENIKEGLKAIGDTVGKSGKNALIIGGVLAGGYLLYRLLSPGAEKEKKVKKIKRVKGSVTQVSPPVADQEEHIVYQRAEPTAVERISERIMEEALVFLLAIAKEKLVEFMHEHKKERDTEED